MQNSLHGHRALPRIAIALDLFPGKSAAHARARESNDLVGAGAFRRIVGEGSKTRIAVTQQREKPSWPRHHLADHPEVWAKFVRKSGVGFTRTGGAHRHIE